MATRLDDDVRELSEAELGELPGWTGQAELFRLSPGSLAQPRRIDRGIASLVVVNPLTARVLLRFSTRAPTASSAGVAGDYDVAVPPLSIAVYPVERYKWVAAALDYAGGATAQDNNLQAIVLESIIAYQPTLASPIMGIGPGGVLTPVTVDGSGRIGGAYSKVRLTGTGTIKASSGVLHGWYVNTTTAVGTITLSDTAGNELVIPIGAAAGSSVTGLDVAFAGNITATYNGGATGDITFFFD